MSTTPTLHAAYKDLTEKVNWDHLTLFDFNEQRVTVQAVGKKLTAFYPSGSWVAIDEMTGEGTQYAITDRYGQTCYFRYISQAVWFGGYLLNLYVAELT